MNWAFFNESDTGFVLPLSSIAFAADLAAPVAFERVIVLASPISGSHLEATSNPGIDPILVSVVDNGPGDGLAVANIKLSDVPDPDWGSITAGTPISLGAYIYGPTPIYLRYDGAAPGAGFYSDLMLQTSDVVEVSSGG